MQGNQTDNTDTFFCFEPEAVYETHLQSIWNRIPLNRKLLLQSGKEMRVLSRGIWNFHAGPDFQMAKLEIDGCVVFGDVEIHRKASDWCRHRHFEDPAYANVILHVVKDDDSSSIQKKHQLPDAPVFLLPQEDILERIGNPVSCSPEGKCAAFFEQLDETEFRTFFSSAGMERMQIKSEAILEDMIRVGSRNAFLLKLFDQIGVGADRDSFHDLADRVLEYPEDIREHAFAAILWGESGLLPDPSVREYPPDAAEQIRELWNTWWPLRREANPPLEWRRHSRPLASVERKLALIAAFVTRYSTCPLPLFAGVLKEWESTHQPDSALISRMEELLQFHDPFWECHSSFGSKCFASQATLCGESRKLELLVNVMVPSLRSYALLRKDLKLLDLTERFFLSLPRTGEHRILKTMVEKCFPRRSKLFGTAAEIQGVLQLYREHCEKTFFDCSACRLNHSI